MVEAALKDCLGGSLQIDGLRWAQALCEELVPGIVCCYEWTGRLRLGDSAESSAGCSVALTSRSGFQRPGLERALPAHAGYTSASLEHPDWRWNSGHESDAARTNHGQPLSVHSALVRRSLITTKPAFHSTTWIPSCIPSGTLCKAKTRRISALARAMLNSRARCQKSWDWRVDGLASKREASC